MYHINPGLTGSYEPYIRTILIRACAPVEKGGLGYRAVVVTVRGCKWLASRCILDA